MADDAVLIALDKRIAAVRENIRAVIARTAMRYTGAAGAPLVADELVEQYALLAGLLKERETAVKNLP